MGGRGSSSGISNPFANASTSYISKRIADVSSRLSRARTIAGMNISSNNVKSVNRLIKSNRTKTDKLTAELTQLQSAYKIASRREAKSGFIGW